jgi:hypothetical protein
MMQSTARNDAQQLRKNEPLYDFDPRTGSTIEVFYADRALAKSLGLRSAGWCWWTCQRSCLPGRAIGPFGMSYSAYRSALGSLGSSRMSVFGRRTGHVWRA